MPVLVRCNKADDPRCPLRYGRCPHAVRHEPHACTTASPCTFAIMADDFDEAPTICVRCVKVKEE